MASAVNEQRYAIGYHYGDGCRSGPRHACTLVPIAKMPRELASVERVVLFHFCTKSLEDYKLKRARAGGTNPVGKPMSFFTQMEKCATLPAFCSAYP